MAHHHFEPNSYHVTIATREPVLTVEPGDTITTTTLDALGFDVAGTQVGPRGNPQTGPFAVRGATPGDTLAVTIDSMIPNRATGFTSDLVAPNVLEPGYRGSQAGGLRDRGIVTWEIDREAGTVRPAGAPELRGLEVPLAPMVGCFGVAPAGGEAISTATSAQHGGNMDYRGFGPGASIFLPVAVPGALFHVGDGHAAQGDGEIVGTGIETTFEVTFTLDVIRGWSTVWPRAYVGDDIATVGNARPLDQCVEHATTEMLRWLINDLGIDERAAHVALGQLVRYDVGNVFDPAYTMVCRLPRQVVERLGGVRSTDRGALTP